MRFGNNKLLLLLDTPWERILVCNAEKMLNTADHTEVKMTIYIG